jgi:programmed cell death protein 4
MLTDVDQEMGRVKVNCQELLHDPKCQQKLADAWGSGAGLVLDETRTAIGRIIKVASPGIQSCISIGSCLLPGCRLNESKDIPDVCLLLQDYLADGNAKDAEKGLQALAVPFFHHEFVRQAVSAALHNGPKEASILQLLGELTESGIVSTNQLLKVILTCN